MGFTMEIEKIKSKKSIKELLEFGIINLDKSSGPTSFNVSEFVKTSLGLRKTSHFGTLDPKVTGVLPVSLNRACKLMKYFLGENKGYVGIMRLHEEVDLEKIKEKIKEKFLGEIIQMPPVKSRVKRQDRPRTIYKFDLLEEDNKDILFQVECEGGTYIRKLIDDLGKELNVGAHMLELRRTKAGIFKEESITSLYDFEKAVNEYKNGNEKLLREIIFPAEIISEFLPVLQIKSENLKQIFTGKSLLKKDLVKDDGWKKDTIVCVFSSDIFVGIYKIFRGREIFAKPEFVM